MKNLVFTLSAGAPEYQRYFFVQLEPRLGSVLRYRMKPLA